MFHSLTHKYPVKKKINLGCTEKDQETKEDSAISKLL